LEQELKARSADLKSSRAVSRFIREITSTITTFIDHHQTDKLMKSYLKDEAGLQKTETLLRNIMARDSGDKILSRIKNLLKERGVKEEEIKKIFGELAAPPRTPDQAPAPDEEKKTKKKKKRKRRAPKPVQEKLEKAIRNLTAEDGDPENTISYLAGVFRREIRKETNELKTENRELTRRLNNIHSALEIAGINLAIIGADGEVLPGPARLRQYFSSEFRIKPAFREFLSEDTSPDTDRKQNFLTNLSPEDKVIYEPLLTGLEKAIVDENGELIGLLFREMS